MSKPTFGQTFHQEIFGVDFDWQDDDAKINIYYETYETDGEKDFYVRKVELENGENITKQLSENQKRKVYEIAQDHEGEIEFEAQCYAAQIF